MNNRLLYFVWLTLCVCHLGIIASAQTGVRLTREDVVIKDDKPSIYLCADTKSGRSVPAAGADVWLKLFNNTVWTIRFNAQRAGAALTPLRLSNGRTVAALQDSSFSYPRYQLEPKSGGNGSSRPLWGGVGTSSWLPSGKYMTFKVPSKYFKDHILFLEYKYEWEFVGTVGQESYSPTHRVYLSLNSAGISCD